jgi:RNA polymerase sigma-70 factor (ECF subfamily)
MTDSQAEGTSITLLGRLRQESADSPAWSDFVARYRPRIYAYCLAFPLQPADAEDVTQAVLVKLIAKMRDFRYDPAQSFRAWLKTVTRNALLDFLDEKRRGAGTGNSEVMRLLENIEAREGLAQQVEAEFDRELLEIALREVQPIVPANQWEAFRLTTLEGKSGAEAAAQLGMLVATVYTAKGKVQKLVRDRIRILEGAAGM